MNRLLAGLRTMMRRMGVEIVRYPPPQRGDQLWESWAAKLESTGEVKTVFDVGANRGQTITWFRPLFPESDIHAFEPLLSAFADLQKIAQMDRRVVPHNVALGDVRTVETMYENSVDTTNSLLPNSISIDKYAPPHMVVPAGQSQVNVERLDQFCQENGIDTIDVLKIDAQGYEAKILAGAGDMLTPSRIRGVYLELMFVPFYKGQCWGGELIEMMRSKGYRLFGLTGISFDEKEGWRWSDAMFVGDDA